LTIIAGHHRGASDSQLPLAQDGGQPLPRAQQLPTRKQPTQTASSKSGKIVSWVHRKGNFAKLIAIFYVAF
jgi:hypothetical protein